MKRPYPLVVVRRLVAVLLAAAVLALPARAQLAVSAVDRVSITVGDLDRSIQFFTQTLDCQIVERREIGGEAAERLLGVFGARCETALLSLGSEHIELVEFVAPVGRPIPDDARSDDRSFQHIAIVVSDMDRAYQRLRDHRVRHASTAPQRLPDWNPNAGGVEAFYFKDPDGHALELIYFPPGKGDPRWQASTEALFLGVDHTAIVVADTNRSVEFYRDQLGMTIAGAGENYGPEQERLNAVFGAHLRITTLRAPGGPGVELLEYLAPSTGRDMPADTRVNDIWSWRTVVQANDPAILAALRAGRARWLSAGPRSPDDRADRVIVADPDGHAVEIDLSAPSTNDDAD